MIDRTSFTPEQHRALSALGPLTLTPQIEAWLTALRQPGRIQTHHRLFIRPDASPDGEIRGRVPGGMCCLGVACDISGKGAWEDAGTSFYSKQYRTKLDQSTNYLPKEVDEWLSEGQGRYVNWRVLAQLNDSGYTFAQIANVIEAATEEQG